MMTHQRCSLDGCWLLACSFLLKATQPKFLLGQSVRLHWTDEFGIYQGCDRGIVTGLKWHPPESCEEWWYQVEWYEAVSQVPKLPWTDEVPESELEADL